MMTAFVVRVMLFMPKVWFCRQKRSAAKHLKISMCICSKKYV